METETEIDQIAERQAKQRHLVELEKFIGSVVHDKFKAALDVDILGTEQAIVMLEPVKREDEIESFKLRGELRCLREVKEIFEDARVTLKARIEDMLDRENQNADNTKV